MENFNSNNVNLQIRDAKSNQLTNGQSHDILYQLLQYMKNKEKLEHGAINKLIFITLQTYMESIMLKGGGNSYKMHHIGK